MRMRRLNFGHQLVTMISYAPAWLIAIAINVLAHSVAVLELGLPPIISAILVFPPSFGAAYFLTSRFTSNSIFVKNHFSLRQLYSGVRVGLAGLSANLVILSLVIKLYGMKFVLIGQILGVLCGVGVGLLSMKSPVLSRLSPEVSSMEISGKAFFQFCLAGLVLACAFHAGLNYFGATFPWNTFLYDPEHRFGDWHYTVGHASAPNPYTKSGELSFANYFPLSYLVLRVGISNDPTVSLLIYFAISILLLGIGVWTASSCRAKSADRPRDLIFLGAGVLISYPVIFAWDRGNIDVWIGFMCVIFSMTLRSKYELLGFGLLCLAIAMKGYPAIFLLMYLNQRQWKRAALCLLLALGLSVAALVFAWDGFAINTLWLLVNLNTYQANHVLGVRSLFASSDPYSAVRLLFQIYQKSILFLFHFAPARTGLEEFSAGLLSWYKYISFALAAVSSIFVVASNAPEWKKLLAVCLVAILFPAVANDYKLCMLFPALFLLVCENQQSKNERIIFLILCFLMVPKSYFFFDDRSISMLINPVLLIFLVIKVVGDRHDWKDLTAFVESKHKRFKFQNADSL